MIYRHGSCLMSNSYRSMMSYDSWSRVNYGMSGVGYSNRGGMSDGDGGSGVSGDGNRGSVGGYDGWGGVSKYGSCVGYYSRCGVGD